MTISNMNPVAASLLSSLRRVSPAAVPAILDCILSTLGSSLLLSSLLEEFPRLSEEIVDVRGELNAELCNYIKSYMCALCHLFKNSGNNINTMQLFIWNVLIPLMKLVYSHDHEIFNELARLFFDVVVETKSWGIVEATIVPFLLRSIGLSMGILQSGELAIYKWTLCTSFARSGDQTNVQFPQGSFDKINDTNLNINGELSQTVYFSLSITCHLLALTLDAALQSRDCVDSNCQSNSGTSYCDKSSVGHLLWDVFNMALQMLSQTREHRSAAISILLPFIFKAFAPAPSFEISINGTKYVFSRKHILVKIWKCCRKLFSLGPSERRDAYALLSLYVSSLLSPDGLKDAVKDGRDDTFDVRVQKQFWEEVRRGLVENESLVRKYSLNILKTVLLLSENTCQSNMPMKLLDENGSDSRLMTKRGRWAEKEAKSMGVGKIYASIDPSFNNQQKWEAFVLLYEMLDEYGTHLVEAAWNHQITLLVHASFSSVNSMNSTNEDSDWMEMNTSESTFIWLAVLWQRGFSHDNPRVRCLIMQSFLDANWEIHGEYAGLVPMDFVVGSLIESLNDPVHHSDFGTKGAYTSCTIQSAARFFYLYGSYTDKRKQIAVLNNLASTAKRMSFGRAGLMCLAECIHSVAHGVQKCDGSSNKVSVEHVPENFSYNDKVDLLDIFRFIIESCKQHFNPKYRRQVCSKILDAATLVMTANDLPLEIIMHFISSLPRESTDYGGLLRLKVQEWLLGGEQDLSLSDDGNVKLLDALCGFPGNFVRCYPSAAYDDEDLETWELEAKKWTRLLFLVAKEQHLDSILMFILDHGMNVCEQRNKLEWIPIKYLVLICSLVNELQVERLKTFHWKVRIKRNLNFADSVGHSSLTTDSSIIEKFTKTFLAILDDLVSFSTLSCSIFWSHCGSEDVVLPGSVTGRLGGPSQRRLSSSVAASVLLAIKSLEVVSAMSRWCAQVGTDISLESTFAFLWKFSWKTIKTCTCNSETEAEICLAAYEALACILKDLVSVFSPLSMDLVKGNQLSSLLEADGEPVLDLFATAFLQNINHLIEAGNLARTRRATLMNWKWTCMESLLSIPNKAHANGIQKIYTFFSRITLRDIFHDLVDSLQNAGEAFVLPMLRSVRLLMELFASQKIGSVGSLCGDISMEMMWHLVHSSWILHISCKKRRVAPIAALLSSILHHSVFGDECMHELDNAAGPFKWFVEKILEEGTKSPRTIRLAALHLTGLWLSNPCTIKYYIKELKLLTMYGSVAFDEDFEAELTENDDAKMELLVLAESPDPELTEEYINTELYARVSVAVMFHKLANWAEMERSRNTNKSSTAALVSGKMFLLELLDSVVNDKDLSKELYKKYSAIHRRKIRAWQMICILSRFVDQDIVQEVMSNLNTSLCRNNMPSVRQYMETFAIHIYLKFPALVEQQLVPLLRNYDIRPQALSSYMFISANVILHSTGSIQSKHLDELLPPIIPLLTSHHHTLRGFTQLLVHQILQKLLFASNCSAFSAKPLEKRCFEDLNHYLTDNPDCARLRASMEGFLQGFDPIISVTPAGIFANRVEELEFECVPVTLMEQVVDFLNDAREDLRVSMANDAATLKNESLHAVNSCSTILSGSANEEQSVTLLSEDVLFDFQRKITFSKQESQETASAIFLDKTLADIEREDELLDKILHSRSAAVEKLKASRQPFIFVASLIDRIPNLAGLARTCEVFRAAGLAIADKGILNDKQFQLISVTAEKWVPIEEVPVSSVKAFLTKKKQEGFAILGLEQTANSFSLDRFVFPKKTVLVLGREKEGIPVEIIHMLDGCVEIPQLGVVRSLNVHVSAAIALWEYTRQQRGQ